MRKLFLTLALVLAAAMPVQAQSNKFEFHYTATLLGAAEINGFASSYNSLGGTFKNSKLMFTANPLVLQWADDGSRFSSEIEGAIRVAKRPLWLGIGRSLSSKYDNHTYGRLSYGGESKFPFLLNVGAGRDYFTTSISIQLKH